MSSHSRAADLVGRHATETGVDEFVADRNERSTKFFRLSSPNDDPDTRNCVEVLLGPRAGCRRLARRTDWRRLVARAAGTAGSCR